MTSRQQATLGYQHCFISETPANDCVISTTSREANQVFPLYLYSTETEQQMGAIERLPNFSEEFIKDFSQKLRRIFGFHSGSDRYIYNFKSPKFSYRKIFYKSRLNIDKSVLVFTPEDIFNYTYAIFHSPSYRARYSEFLKIDFPRLPLTSNLLLFRELAKHGKKLVELHLLKKDIETDVTFPIKGSDIVESAPKYENGKVKINKAQYFDNVPEDTWNFHIGGYQVLNKWLKDRKDRKLSFDEKEHYTKIVSALINTIEIMQTIDETIEENGGFPIQ